MSRFQIYREDIYFLCVYYVNLGGEGEKVFDFICFVSFKKRLALFLVQ